jgi:hypothetical protein
LTTYGDYLPELAERREDVLPAKPAHWVRTSGRSGEYSAKWVPLSDEFSQEFEKVATSLLLFASGNGRGDLSQFKEHSNFLFTLAPEPFASGVLGYCVQHGLGWDFLPSNAGEMSFQERIKAGFEQALYRGLDGLGGLSITLLAVGEQFSRRSGKRSIRPLLSHPGALFRITKGLIKSKLASRPMLPKDLWSVRWIMGGGADASIFKEKVKELWGRYSLDVYGGSEGAVYATQTWDYDTMTFVPNLNFFEFIPEREWFKWQLDRSYQPKTVLLDEVNPGENYEIVITNLHGGILTRYRVGDIVKITSLRNEKLSINLPQMVFERRADDLIDLGLMRLTEKVIWQAIENTGVPYTDWTARKEMIDDRPVLRVYLELKNNYVASEKAVAGAIYEHIKSLDDGFIHEDLESVEKLIAFKPIEVTLLPQGAFSAYIAQRQAEGVDLAHLKPPHMNPSDKILSLLGAPTVVVEAVPASEAERIPTR